MKEPSPGAWGTVGPGEAGRPGLRKVDCTAPCSRSGCFLLRLPVQGVRLRSAVQREAQDWDRVPAALSHGLLAGPPSHGSEGQGAALGDREAGRTGGPSCWAVWLGSRPSRGTQGEGSLHPPKRPREGPTIPPGWGILHASRALSLCSRPGGVSAMGVGQGVGGNQKPLTGTHTHTYFHFFKNYIYHI